MPSVIFDPEKYVFVLMYDTHELYSISVSKLMERPTINGEFAYMYNTSGTALRISVKVSECSSL